jgi:hypothetical protein
MDLEQLLLMIVDHLADTLADAASERSGESLFVEQLQLLLALQREMPAKIAATRQAINLEIAEDGRENGEGSR